MSRTFGLAVAILLASASAVAAEESWDSYIARELSPPVLSGFAARSAETPQAIRASRKMTSVLLQARRHWHALSPSTQALAGGWVARPDAGSGDNLGGGVYVYINPAHESTQPTAHFRIHYVNAATYGADVNKATAAYVADVATALEAVYTAQHTTLAYDVPPSDGTRGGDGRYDVYIANLGSLGFYGYTAPESSAQSSYSYIVIDNNYAEAIYGDDPTAAMQVTLAHEYFHAVQMGYDQNEDLAWMENTATWMESVVYPDTPAAGNNDNFQYLGEVYTDANGNGRYDNGEPYTDRNSNGQRDSGSVDYPHASLDAFDTPFSTIQYGRFLWPQYLSEDFDNDLIKEIWEQCAAVNGDNAFAAMNTALTARGSSLAAAYQTYAVWGYDTASFGNGAYYPRVRLEGVADTTADFSSRTAPSLNRSHKYMSTVYLRINDPSGDYRFNSNGNARLTMVTDDGAGNLTATPVVLTGNRDGTWTAAGTEALAIAVISNVSTSACMSWAFASGTTDATLGSCTGGGADAGHGGGGGALDLLALALAGLLGARRRYC